MLVLVVRFEVLEFKTCPEVCDTGAEASVK